MKNKNINPRLRRVQPRNTAKTAAVALLGVVIGVSYTYTAIRGVETFQALASAPSSHVFVQTAKAQAVEEAPVEEPAPSQAPLPEAPKVTAAMATREKIDTLLRKEFPAEDVAHARRVVWCESRYNAEAHNQNPATGDDSVGLGQINLLGGLFQDRLKRAQHLGYTGEPTREALTEWLKIPENNIRFFASMKSASGWHHWSCSKKVDDPNWKYRAQMLAFLEG